MDTHHKTKTVEKAEKPNKDKGIIIALVIIIGIIIIFFALFFIIKNASNGDNANKVTYNHYIFEKQSDQAWYVNLNIKNTPYTIPFYYNPKQVDNISIDNTTMQTLSTFINNNPSGTVYVSVSPNDTSKVVIAGVELAKILGQKYNIFNMNVHGAISSSSGDENATLIPVIDCKNATFDTMVIMIEVGTENKIRNYDNCFILTGDTDNNTIKVADSLAFRILTIIR